MTPEEYQAKLMTMQAELQQQISEVQAKGDFASIATLSAEFQKKIMALAAEFSSSFMPGIQEMATMAAVPDMNMAMNTDDSLPTDDESTKLMLLGAMYVEENERLVQLDKNLSSQEYKANEKQILVECFCALDMGVSDIAPERVREVLKDSWGVDNKESLVNVLAWLLKEGHHQQLMQLISFCKANTSLETRTIERYREQFDQPLAYENISEESFRRGLILAESKEARLSSAGIRAWDIARYVHVLRFGYMSRFIHADECWLHLKRLSSVVSEFTDWRDYSHSYIVGYRWWSGTAGPIEDACQRLLDHPKSPWTYFGWIG